MRPDKQKLQARQKSGAKDDKKDRDERRQPQAASKPSHEVSDDNALAKERRPERKGPTLH